MGATIRFLLLRREPLLDLSAVFFFFFVPAYFERNLFSSSPPLLLSILSMLNPLSDLLSNLSISLTLVALAIHFSSSPLFRAEFAFSEPKASYGGKLSLYFIVSFIRLGTFLELPFFDPPDPLGDFSSNTLLMCFAELASYEIVCISI